MSERTFEGFDQPEPIILEELVSLGKSMGLEVNENDIDDLVEEHGEELTTEELKDLQQQQQSEVLKAWEEETVEEEEEMVATKDMKEMSMWEKLREFVEKNHLEKVATVRAADLFNNTCLTHFRNILKGRSKQTSLGMFLIKRPLRDESDSRKVKKQCRLSESEDDPEVVESVIDEKDDDEGGGQEEMLRLRTPSRAAPPPSALAVVRVRAALRVRASSRVQAGRAGREELQQKKKNVSRFSTESLRADSQRVAGALIYNGE
ncbi:hypothetical protein MHYP_G00269390 [Metynnis hypsauchen]